MRLQTAAPAWALVTTLFLAAGAAPVLQAAPKVAVAAKKAITHDVYATWRTIPDAKLSRDGQWAVYVLQGLESDGELVARNLKTGLEHRTPRGRSPQISADGRFVAFLVEPTQADKEKAKKDKKKPEDGPKPSFGLMDLTTGRVSTVDKVKGFKLPEEGGTSVAILLEPKKEEKKDKKGEAAKPGEKAPEKSTAQGAADDDQARRGAAAAPAPAGKKEGSDLLVRNLATGETVILAEVTEYAWNKVGSRLATVVASKDAPGVFLREMADGSTVTLAKGKGTWKGVTFDDKGGQVAFLGSLEPTKAKEEKAADKPAEEAEEKKDDKKDEPEVPKAFSLYHWQVGAKTASVVAANGTTGLPQGWSPSGDGSLDFSKDGQRLFFGSAKTPVAEPKDAPEPLKVDLWHWQDPQLQTLQKVRAEEEKKRSYRAVMHVADHRIVQLGTPELPEIRLNENAEVALGFDDRAYRLESSWDPGQTDAWVVNLKDGSRRKVFEKVRFGATLSPAGRYVLAFDHGTRAWKAASTLDGSVKTLTGGLKVAFYNEETDTPEEPHPHGVAGWTEGDGEVVVYDQFDLWALKPDGSASRCVTGGEARKRKLELRHLQLDPEAHTLPATLMLSGTNDATKATGFFTVDLKGGALRQLIYGDRLHAGLQKAKAADTVLFTQQSFQEFPDLWTTSLAFQAPKRISQANPQQAEFAWGSQELIEYVNADGKTLKALLAKPEGFDPKKQYPMMVYIYEGMTDNLHRHVVPAPGQNINITRFTSNGYLVLRPDITFEVGHPGRSAEKCVLPAVAQQIAKGFVDKDRIGIQGHSWGGYQITHLVTQTNLFRCVEAGASVSNMISAYGGIRYGTGIVRQFQYEHQQSRIGGTPWTKPMEFIENSPIFQAHQVTTPYLTLHNDGDDAVPFTQAIEFFTALRRLGKEAYLFNYNGQPHGLRDRDAIKHFTVHMCEFFDHYLKGAPRPSWMTTPTPYLERGKRDMKAVYQPGK